VTRAALAGLIAMAASAACKCDATYGPCRETASANVIFIGRVESVSPTFLDSWSDSQRASLDLLNREYEQSKSDRSPDAFARLRDAYLKVFPDLPPEHRNRLEHARSSDQLTSLFYWILDHGKRVRLTVHTMYRNGDEDDDDRKDTKTIEIWTPFGECGVNFQAGETYLVYADSDEESDVITTTACHRTRRLPEAGDDLAYLFFLKNQPKQAARIEAFVSTDADALKRRDREHYSDRVASPLAGAVVEAENSAVRVRAETDEHGRVVFDGLSPGDYRVTAYATGYPTVKHVLAGPQTVVLDQRGCASELLLAHP
jgi:Carboxypeptidase regulatory-like domain